MAEQEIQIDLSVISNWKQQQTESVIDQFAGTLSKAEEARRVLQNQSVHEVFNAITVPTAPEGEYLTTVLLSRELSPLQRDQLVGGFLGSARLEIVSTVADMKQTTDMQERERLAQTYLPGAELVIATVGLDNAPPFTIHGGGINFPAEIAQDRANAQEALGRTVDAQRTLEIAIAENQQRLISFDPQQIDFQTPDGELSEKMYDMYKNRKDYIGSLWAQPVLSARLGRLNHEQATMARSVREAQRAFHYEQNGARLATLAIWSGSAALSPTFHGTIPDRSSGFTNAIRAFRQAKKVDASGSMAALNQFINQRTVNVREKLLFKKRS